MEVRRAYGDGPSQFGELRVPDGEPRGVVVVVHGGFYILSPDEDAWNEGLELVRTAVPEALTDGDPTPFRTVLFRIAVQESSGREGTSGHQASAAPQHDGGTTTRTERSP